MGPLLLLLSGHALFLSAWIVVPAPTMLLLPLAVGAPEVSLWLLVVQLLLTLVAARGARRSRLRRAALAASSLGVTLSVIPLVQLPSAIRRADRGMRAGLGRGYDSVVPEDGAARPRRKPFVLVDAFVGLGADSVRYMPRTGGGASEGSPLPFDLYRPLRPGIYPAVIAIYGGAWQRGDPSANAVFHRYLASRGYAVFAVDYRHAPRYRFPAQLDDVRAAMRVIRARAAEYGVDAARIALVGRSSGAHLALLAAYEPAVPAVRAVIGYYGPTDLVGGYADPPRPDPIDVREVLRTLLGGTPEEMPERYRAASPSAYASPAVPPTLLIHGARDHVVKVRFGRELHERLRSAGARAVLLEIPWSEHAFDEVFRGPGSQLALYHAERFLAWALRE